jgi:hypothetical protein
MIVKIRVGKGRRVRRKGGRNRRLALAAAVLLMPLSLTAFVIGCWRLAADAGLTAEFAFADGLLSHWQVWAGIAFFLQTASALLNRYGSAVVEGEEGAEAVQPADSDSTGG